MVAPFDDAQGSTVSEGAPRPSRRAERLAYLAILSVPFIAAWVCSPRITMEQYELPKHVGLVLAVAVLLGGTGLKRCVGGVFAHPPLAGLLAAIGLAVALSCSLSASLFGEYENIEGLLTWGLYGMLFLAGSHLAQTRQPRLVAAILLAAAGSAGYALLQAVGMDPFPGEYFRHVRAFAGNPDFLAQQIAMALPFVLVALLRQGARWGGALTAVLLLVLTLTGSRAGMLAGVTALVLVGWWSRDQLRPRRRLLASTGLGLAVALLVSFQLVAPDIALPARFAALLSRQGLAETRGLMWHGVAEVGRERPLAGWGPDTLAMAFLTYAPRGWASLEGMGTTARKAHNEPLHFLASTGVLGLGMYLWLLVYAGRRWFQRRTQPWSMAAGASITAYLVHNLFSFGTAATAPVFWLLLGMICRPRRDFAHPPWSRVSCWPWISAIAAVVMAAFAVVRLAADTYAYRGNEAGRAGDRAAEARAFTPAMQLAPWEPLYLVRRARALEQLGRLEAALSLFERSFALRTQDGLRLGHVGRVRFELAAARGDTAGQEAAWRLLLQAVDLAPSQPSVYTAAIMGAQRLGRIAERDHLIRRLQERDPGWAEKLLGPYGRR